MRSLFCLHATLLLIAGGSASCFAQQPGPATLEGLLNSDESLKPAAAAEADTGPKRPAGTVARPKDGVQHPDLDKAWTDYDAAVGKVAGSIKTAIAKQFDAATAKGDLDAAEKWQVIGEKFEKAGELPSESATKTVLSSAVAEYKKAKDDLAKAYEAVMKTLTMEKKIPEAKAVRNELRGWNEGSKVIDSSGGIASTPKMIDQFIVEALVDGDSELCITPAGIYWRSLGVAKPGRHGGRNEPTFVNGQAWRPQWGQPNQERGRDETTPFPLAVGDLNIGFEVVAVGANRGDRGTLGRTPVNSRRESDKLVIAIPDKDPGSVWYTIKVFRIREP